MRKPSLDHAFFDAVLTRAFTDAVTEELCAMEQVCPRDVQLSEKYRRIERKAYRKWEKANGEPDLQWIPSLRRVAVWVLIAGFLGLTLAFAVPTVRAGFCNLVVSVYEKYISFEGPGHSEQYQDMVFVHHIEYDVYVSYTGDDPVVAVPEDTAEIGAYAFADAAVPVERIEIPASVERIHPQAFMGLSSLKEIAVAEDNQAFRMAEQYLIAADGSIVFAFCEELWGNSVEADPFETVNSVDAQKFFEDGFRLVFHDAVLYFREPDERDLTDGYDTKYCPLYQIEAFGYSAEFEEVRFPGNHRCSLYTAENRIVFTDYEAGGMGDTYIFSEDGIWEQHNSASLTEENYNDTICSFLRSEDGQLKFRCSPRKFLLIYLSLGELLPYCVSRDELWRICGSVEFDRTEPVFTVEETVRVGEQFDEKRLEDERAMHHKMMSYTAQPEWETLDELFAYNAEQYEEWLGE